MDNEDQDFSQLKKLLALKRHEQPPPGYFNKFSGNVISRIRAEQSPKANSLRTLENEAPWLMRFWRMLGARPMVAGTFGAAVCGLVLFGIVMSEKPEDRQNFAGPSHQMNNGTAVAGTGAGGLDSPIILATNQAAPDLFQMIPGGQTAPVSFTP